MTETDHNSEILELNIKFSKIKPERREIFNLKNKTCQEKFREITENNDDLLKCFENELPAEKQLYQWKKSFQNILHKSFRKVRITDSKKKKEELEKESKKAGEWLSNWMSKEDPAAKTNDQVLVERPSRIAQLKKKLGIKDDEKEINTKKDKETEKETFVKGKVKKFEEMKEGGTKLGCDNRDPAPRGGKETPSRHNEKDGGSEYREKDDTKGSKKIIWEAMSGDRETIGGKKKERELGCNFNVSTVSQPRPTSNSEIVVVRERKKWKHKNSPGTADKTTGS